MTDHNPSARSFWPRHVSWLTVLFAVLAVVSFLVIARSSEPYAEPLGAPGATPGVMPGGVMEKQNTGTSGGSIPPSAINAPASGMGAPSNLSYPYPPPYPNPDVPVTDTREFLKTYYNATMRTRDVQGLTRRVETTVRGYDGRIDQESVSPQYGMVSFVVPQSKYDAFRAELEGLVDSRFLTVSISSENLLPQKLSIEEQQKQADAALASYQAARQKLVATHASTVRSLQAKIDDDTQQLAALHAQPQTPEVRAQIQTVSDDLASQKQRLASENASYASQLQSADANVKSAQDWQKGVQTQDTALLNNVATVTGTVSVQWISLWEIVHLYLPGYWLPFIFTLLTVASFIHDRRRFGAAG